MALSIREPSLPYIPHGKFGILTGYIFVLNSTIGAGFLSIPWAYENSGWFFSLIFQILTTILCYYLSIQTLESMSRAEILSRMTEEGKDIHRISFKKLFQNPNHPDHLLKPPPHLTPMITNRLINLPDIVKMVFGERVGLCYLIFVIFSVFGILVAYGSVFASSFASIIPLGPLSTCDIYTNKDYFSDCKMKYSFFLLFFAICVCYMTVKGIEEQQYVQYIMSGLRFIVIISITLTCFADIVLHRDNNDSHYNSADAPPMIRPKNIGHAIPIILFATIFQNQIPTIASSIKNKEKTLAKVNGYVSMTCFFVYTLLGMAAAFAIDHMPSMVTMSYRDYTGGYSKGSRPGWTYVLEYLIVLCPAFDVFSSYPIQALVLANSITTWRYGGNEEDIPKRVFYGIRFLSAFIPLIVSFLVYDLGTILDWTGLFGFLGFLIATPLFHLALRHMVAGESPYDAYFNIGLSWAIIIVNAFLFFAVVGLNLVE
ncbi:hypothetical protein SteCoe_4365 [Stentor coeruleus]|uniref:Amino acid transporter transmembrane domain-containing protein n=1 Tax=Stentor coeruleus TaxID=5963 RepID=A0A1R2CV28_9CILI|nr:hypothetical protein SteCoe_4365 [Stentor coeruleus]